MTEQEAVNLAQLWKVGKLIGGDPYEVADALVEMVDKLQKDAERYRLLREIAWKEDDQIVIRLRNCSIDFSTPYALDESVDFLKG